MRNTIKWQVSGKKSVVEHAGKQARLLYWLVNLTVIHFKMGSGFLVVLILTVNS
ncbi:MAG: hypothetical protein ACC656_08280 [Candidatus Heimdallarchaeota archaeon]